MTDTVYDTLCIGGGPAGLMCALTAVGGTPINPPRHFSGLVIDRFDIGQFAKYGKLRLTYRWHLMGPEVIRTLASEAKQAGVELKANTEAVGADLSGDIKVVETTAGTFRARTVAICTGFFPHGNLMKHHLRVRPMFSPMGMEERIVPQAEGLPVLLIGRGAPAVAQARELLRLRSGLELTVVLDGDAEIPRDLDGLAVHHGFIKVLDEKKDCVDIALLDVQKNEVARRTFRFALVDYNSYTTQTRVTRFLESAGVTTRAGYIAVDQWGATGIPGVVAAGNVVTPVSGVLTALSTAFSAGLSLFAMLHKDRFGKAPYLYPWLPAEGLDAHPLAR